MRLFDSRVRQAKRASKLLADAGLLNAETSRLIGDRLLRDLIKDNRPGRDKG